MKYEEQNVNTTKTECNMFYTNKPKCQEQTTSELLTQIMSCTDWPRLLLHLTVGHKRWGVGGGGNEIQQRGSIILKTSLQQKDDQFDF